MKDDDPRKKDWNEEYLKYWHERVAEAGSGNSEIISGDARTSSDEVWTNLINRTRFLNEIAQEVRKDVENGIITSGTELMHAVHDTRETLNDKARVKRKTSQATRTATGRLTTRITNIIVRCTPEKRTPCLLKY